MSHTEIGKPQDASQRLRMQTIIAWAVTALGVIAFHLFHLYAAIGGLVAAAAEAGHDHDHDHDHGHGEGGHLEAYAAYADHNSGYTWMVAAFLVLMVIPSVIALLSASKGAAIATLAIGAVATIPMIMDGFMHGLGEAAWSSTILALAAIGLPAAVAVIKNVKWMRATRRA